MHLRQRVHFDLAAEAGIPHVLLRIGEQIEKVISRDPEEHARLRRRNNVSVTLGVGFMLGLLSVSWWYTLISPQALAGWTVGIAAALSSLKTGRETWDRLQKWGQEQENKEKREYMIYQE